jgi:large-conductance mechanosensitive channel
MTILSDTNNAVGNFHDTFKRYLSNGDVIGLAAAVCIGIATKDITQRFLDEVILPILKNFGQTKLMYLLYQYMLKKTSKIPALQMFIELFGKTIWLFVAWSFLVFIAYILLKKLITNNYISTELGTLNKIGNIAVAYEENPHSERIPNLTTEETVNLAGHTVLLL